MWDFYTTYIYCQKNLNLAQVRAHFFENRTRQLRTNVKTLKVAKHDSINYISQMIQKKLSRQKKQENLSFNNSGLI